jgi:TP901 family phage tail tape measure protein
VALTGRDIMFTLRAQDMASRQVRGLAGSFGYLEKRIQAVNSQMSGQLATSTRKNTEDMNRLAEQGRRVNNMYKERIENTRRQIAQGRDRAVAGAHLTEQLKTRALKDGNDQLRVRNAEINKQLRMNSALTSFQQARMRDERAMNREEIARNQQRINQAARYRQDQVTQIRAAAKAQLDADTQSLKSAQQNYQRRLAMTQQSVKQRHAIERAHIQAIAEDQTRAMQRQQAMTQRAMMGGAALSMIGGLMLGAGVKVINTLRGMTTEAGEFNRVIALAVTQVDGFNTNVGELTEIALDVAREVPAAMDTIPQTLYFLFSSLDVSLENSRLLLRGFAREAVAGNASVEDSARSTMAILNGMGLVTKDQAQLQENLTRVQDFQFQTVRKGVITYAQLASNVGKLIPALRRTNQEIEMGGAMMTFLTRNGLSAEMAATAAARSLELMGDPRVVGALEGMGITVRDNVTGEFIALDHILLQLNDHIGHLASPERAAAMLEIFGGAGYRIQARRFFDTVFTNFESFQQHVSWAINNSGAFERALSEMMDTPAAKAQLLENNIAALRMEFGEQLFPVWMQLVDAGRTIVEWFASLEDSTKRNIVTTMAYAAAVLAVVGPLVLISGLLLTLGSLISMATGVGVGLATVMTGGLLGAVVVLGTALLALAANWTDLNSILDKARDYFSGVDGQMRAVIATLAILTVGGWGWVAVSTAMTGTSLGLRGSFVAIAGAAKAAGGSISALAFAHPVLLALTAATIAAVAIYRDFTKEARDLAAATDAHESALSGMSRTVASSREGFESRNEVIRDAAEQAAFASLKEKDLEETMESITALRRGGYVDAIVGSNAQRQIALELIDAEIEGMEAQLSNLEKFVRWTDQFAWGESGFGQLGDVDSLKQLREELERQADAHDDALESQLRLTEARGEAGAIIADYIRMEEGLIPSTILTRGAQYQLVEALFAQKDAFEDLTPEMQRMILANPELAEAAGQTAEEIEELTASAQGLLTALSGAVDPSNAWAAALQVAQDAIAATDGDVNDAKVSLGGWIAAMRETNTETVGMWSNMRAIWSKETAATRTDVNNTIGVILEMGEAGPEAMQLLANADPEEFLEVLNQIRLHAALTSENVQGHFNDMVIGMESIADQYSDISDQQFNDIFSAIVLVAQQYGEETEWEMSTLMDALAQIIASGQDPTVAEMEAIGAALAMTAAEGGNQTVTSLVTALNSGAGDIASVLATWSAAMADGINPIISTLNGKPIVLTMGQSADARRWGAQVPGRSGSPGRLADGGFTPLPKNATIQNAQQQLVQWAEPETHGEAFIPLAPSKRQRSIAIWRETGRRLNVDHAFAEGGFQGTDDVPAIPSFAPYREPLIIPPKMLAEHVRAMAMKFVQENAAPQLSGGVGWQAMWAAVGKKFGRRVALHSAYRPGAITATGNPSYHGMGRAIDITPSMEIFDWIVKNYRNSREIIYSPAGGRQIHNGRNHMYTGITRSMHFDHIHWAMAMGGILDRMNGMIKSLPFGSYDSGGMLPTGLSLAYNGTGRPEPVGHNLPYGDNLTGNFTGGVPAILSWMGRAMPKYQKNMREATADNLEATRKMLSAVGTMRTHIEAQHGLADARREVNNLRNEIIKLASDAEKAELTLAKAWEEAKKITAEEELNIISARRQVRQATQDYEEFQNGIHDLNQELNELQQEKRIAEMRQSLEELSNEDYGNVAELKDNLREAQAALTGAQFEWERVQQVLPNIEDPVQRLLAQFQAENALAESHKALTEATKALADGEREAITRTNDRRIAEIELALAEDQLNRLRENRLWTDESMRVAQLELLRAQEALTEAEREAVGPTEAVREAEERLKEIREQQTQTAEALRQAHIDVSLAEFSAIEATMGLISAGQELAALGPEQTRFFRELAAAAGMSAESINNVVRATSSLGGNSANIDRAISRHSGVDKKVIEEGFDAVYGRVRDIFKNRRVTIATSTETERERLTRIVHEVMSGQRTLDSVRASVDRLKKIGIGTYDDGGILPPGYTLAYNGTGSNEYVTKEKPGKTIVIQEGAIKLEFNGPVDSTTIEDVKQYVDDTFEEMIRELYSQGGE